MILGRLKSMGYTIRVTRARVRDALRSVDPINTALRWQGGLQLEDLTQFLDLIPYGI